MLKSTTIGPSHITFLLQILPFSTPTIKAVVALLFPHH